MVVVFFKKKAYRNIQNCFICKSIKYSIWKVVEFLFKKTFYEKNHSPVIPIQNIKIKLSH